MQKEVNNTTTNFPQLSNFLPTTVKEARFRGWEQVDVVLFSGDAYVDHPAFANAIIGRVIENQGLKIAIVPQPNWQDDLRDFKKFGRPRLFFAVSAGNMDSMVNHYTANRRRRSDDAYTPDGRAGARPDRTTIVYCQILKKLYVDVPIIIGGIEVSMRRLTHYDYWDNQLKQSILTESGADIAVYGMGEEPIIAIINALKNGTDFSQIKDVPQTFYLSKINPQNHKNAIFLHSHEDCLKDKIKYAENFKIIEEESNKTEAKQIIQKTENQYIIINPPYSPVCSEELDTIYDLPFTRLPHPKYLNKTIPAYEMIKFSVNIHRGCFGGCAFCTISAHQGKFISSRTEKSILNEVKKITQMPDFKGYISDLGGPSANMYKMGGKNLEICKKCTKPSCIFPVICKNLNTDLQPLINLYKKIDALPEIKKSFIGSGIRYDMLLDEKNENHEREYINELIINHVSGRLKVAPEHTEKNVLQTMRKADFDNFEKFKNIFNKINTQYKLNQQLIPYFISSHPACCPEDMAQLAIKIKNMNLHPEQIQDFTPTPMTLATEMFYTQTDIYSQKNIFVAKTKEEKLLQRMFFFWYKKEYKNIIINYLRKKNRNDIIKKLY
ncbi:MAG: YgiQ family radical SAM protein [Paludibacter sp.]|nr:YgiQ family radical SAM protein [Paludibacter sp.]